MIRPAIVGDAADIADIYGHAVRDTAASFETEPPDAAEMTRRMGEMLGAYPCLVAETDGALVGFTSASPYRPRPAYRFAVSTAIYVAEAQRGTGIGRRLVGALLAALRKADFHTAIAGITLPNPASVRLHETLGFRAIGIEREVGWKFGRWHDVGRWQAMLA